MEEVRNNDMTLHEPNDTGDAYLSLSLSLLLNLAKKGAYSNLEERTNPSRALELPV